MSTITELELDAYADRGRPPVDHVPANEHELAWCLTSWEWRLYSGQLYKIIAKEATPDSPASVINFIPNKAQRRLLKSLWHRNIILKARQLGFTTVTCIAWLDHALFNGNQRCGVIAQDMDAAKAIFKDKVKFVYENLPDQIRDMFRLSGDSADELKFKHNNSSLRVAVSMRSGTIHRLLVSEFGAICAKYPEKAEEIVTGSLPAVPIAGIAVIESTARGQDGEFYRMTQRAIKLKQQSTVLTPRDYRFHFFPWWQEDTYVLPEGTGTVVITPADEEYFEKIEVETGRKLSIEQRRWYVATRDGEFTGNPERMWAEYPSTPTEAFQISHEGHWYPSEMTALRKRGGICVVPHLDGIPVNTFWDIGNSDGTAVWLHQRQGLQDRFIKFIEGWGEPYSYYTKALQTLGYLWGTHFLPHDAEHQRQQLDVVAAPIDELRKSNLGGMWLVVPRVDDLMHGIQLTRSVFGNCVFDIKNCAAGIAHLDSYGKIWNTRQGCWSSQPDKASGHSEAADAFRQYAQAQSMIAVRLGGVGLNKKRMRDERSWKTA